METVTRSGKTRLPKPKHLRSQENTERWLRSGEVESPVQNYRYCSVEGCGRITYALVLCKMHHARLTRHGDPLLGSARSGPGHTHWKEVKGYGATHQYVVRTKGRAADYPCVDCGQQGHAWSYDHADADELADTKGKNKGHPYSLHVAHYQSRCRSCHAKFDWRHRS